MRDKYEEQKGRRDVGNMTMKTLRVEGDRESATGRAGQLPHSVWLPAARETATKHKKHGIPCRQYAFLQRVVVPDQTDKSDTGASAKPHFH